MFFAKVKIISNCYGVTVIEGNGKLDKNVNERMKKIFPGNIEVLKLLDQ